MRKVISLLALTVGMWTMVFLCFNGCTVEGTTIEENAIVEMGKIPIAVDETGKTIYLGDSSAKEYFEKKYTGYTYVEPVFEKGRGGKKRIALLTIPQENLITTQAVTNVMFDPVTYEGELPTNDNGGLVDFDGDGNVDDLIEYNTRCYFPRTFAYVTVSIDGQNTQVINNSIAFGAELLGFTDADGDGDQDIIWSGGNHYKFNTDDNGNIETYSPYNVGYNTFAEEPTPLADLVASLTLTQSVSNPNYVRWDLGSQYEAYVFHVMWWEVDVNGDVVGGYYQTHTYGEFGILSNNFAPNSTYKIRFSNVAEPCEDVEITFSL